MLDATFIPPDPIVSQRETKRRLALIEEFLPMIRPAINGFLLCGSMANGRNYSVTEKSDIDMLLIVTPTSVRQLRGMNLFQENELRRALEAYDRGIVENFTLTFVRGNVKHECHFWDEDAYIRAITMHSQTTLRLRGSTAMSSDYGYSLDGKEHVQDFPGVAVGEYFVSNFPTYRDFEGVRYYGRPISNVLGAMKIILADERLQRALNSVWCHMTKALREHDLPAENILNCLPGKNKISPESKVWIVKRMREEMIGVALSRHYTREGHSTNRSTNMPEQTINSLRPTRYKLIASIGFTLTYIVAAFIRIMSASLLLNAINTQSSGRIVLIAVNWIILAALLYITSFFIFSKKYYQHIL